MEGAMKADAGAILEPVDRTLARVAVAAPALAARAGAAIRAATAPLSATCWPELATGFSRLTNTGYPLEFAWCSRDAELRWTAELAPPEVPHVRRLDLALRAAGIGLEEAGPWREAQQSRVLRYGAWLGVRHRPDGDARKAYAELPACLPPAWAAHPLLRSTLLAWRMAGLGADGSVEFYARGAELDAAMLRGAEAAAFGGEGRLVAAARALLGRDELPRPSGLSLAFDRGGMPKALAWFVFAKAVFRDDAACGAALARMARGEAERCLLAALAGGQGDGRWRHGMLGLVLGREGEVWLQAGIRPA